jgi:hypothetical protein
MKHAILVDCTFEGKRGAISPSVANMAGSHSLLNNFTDYMFYAGAGLVCGVALGTATALASLSWYTSSFSPAFIKRVVEIC